MPTLKKLFTTHIAHKGKDWPYCSNETFIKEPNEVENILHLVCNYQSNKHSSKLYDIFKRKYLSIRNIEMKLSRRALRSKLLSEISSRVSSRNEFSRVETSSEKARITRSSPNFRKTAITETRENENREKTRFFAKIRVGTSFRESGRVRKKLE